MTTTPSEQPSVPYVPGYAAPSQSPAPDSPMPALAPQTQHRRPRRRAVPIVLTLAIVGVLAVGGGIGWYLTRDTTFTIRGTVELVDDDLALGTTGCSGQGGYGDMRGGAQVTVTDPSGAVIAVGSLGEGYRKTITSSDTCVFPFEVAAVPGGHAFYGVEVSRRGRLQYPAAQARDSAIELSLGT